jgi:hypothetical protein
MRGVVADWTVFVGIRSRPVKVDVGDDDIGYSCLAGSENVPWTRTTTIPYSSGYIPGHSRSSLHEALFLVVKRVLTLYG